MMALEAMLAPQTEKRFDPQPTGARTDMLPNPTGSPESGRGSLSCGPNKGPLSELGVLPTPWATKARGLPVPRPKTVGGWPQKGGPRWSGPATKAPRRAWRAG
jgi:hypothetical protein